MAQEANKPVTDDTVLEFKSDSKTGNDQREHRVLEINQQMSMLEESIDVLDEKLTTTNQQIQSDVERLTDSDADITERFTTTYKQLGIIEASLQQLSTESGKLNTELEQVNTNIRAFEQEAAAALDNAVETQSEVNDTFRLNHEDIVERAEKLSQKASELSSRLTKSINENGKALAELEERIVSELETVAHASEQRDADLNNRIDSISDGLSNQKAKMLLMQDADAALANRATALEATSARLVNDSARLQETTEELNVITDKLGADVDALKAHTRQLAEQNTRQEGFINSLLERTTLLSNSLLALSRTEKMHFHIMSVISLLIILPMVAVYYVYQQQREQDLMMQSTRDMAMSQDVVLLQGQLTNEQAAKARLQREVVDLQQNIVQMEGKIKGMNDQVESLDGRVQYLAPLHGFGIDNTIHGSHWLQQLQPESYSVHVATVADKQDMYDIAQRYNHYFQGELAYYIDQDQRYHLIYGGKFATQQDAIQTISRMPRYINNQPLWVIANSSALAEITQ
jgi:chromosome segregation ATPase